LVSDSGLRLADLAVPAELIAIADDDTSASS
jgi:hypothetical protein